MGSAVFPSYCLTWDQNYGGVDEENGDLLQNVPCMHCHTQSPCPCIRQLPTYASTRDSWTHTGKSGSVSCGVTAPFSWVLMHTGFCLCPPESVSTVLYKFWRLCGGVNGDLLQKGLCYTQVCRTQSPCPCGSPLLTCTSTGDAQTHKGSLVQSLLGSWCAQGFVGAFRASLVGMGFDSKCDFTHPTIPPTGVLQSMESQRVRHDWATELTDEVCFKCFVFFFFFAVDWTAT